MNVGVTAVTAAQTKRPAPLRWARPDTTGWQVINLDAYDFSQDVVIDLGTSGGNFVVHQTVAATSRVRFKTAGPTNIAWIGGEIRIDDVRHDDTAQPDTATWLGPMEGCNFDGDFRLIYIEGVLIHGDQIVEGIDVYNGFAAMPVIQNSRIVINPPVLHPNVQAGDGLYHNDCFQTWSGVVGLRIANTTMITICQGGMFGDDSYPDQPIAMQWGYTELHRVNYGMGSHTPTTNSGWRFLNFVQNDRLVGPFIFDQVYADPRPRKWGLGDHGGTLYDSGCFWEGAESYDSTTGRYRWTFSQPYPSQGVWGLDQHGNRTSTEGYVMRGRPSGGDFCPVTVPGLHYQPPAQIVSEPFAIGGISEENHLANRPVARTAKDYLNGSTFISRKWTVQSGPTAVGDLTTNTHFQTNIFNTIGTYFLQYQLVTSSGTATSTMRLDVIAGRPNWMLNGTDFSLGLDEWVKSDTNPGNYTFDRTGSDARIIASAAGSISVRDRYSNSTKPTRVYPGEQFTVSVNVRQIVGTGARARIQMTWLTEGQIPLSFEDPEVYFSLTLRPTQVYYTFTVPAGAGCALWFLAFTDVEAGDEFRFRDTYLGDVLTIAPANLLGGDVHFDYGLGEWSQTNNPTGFTMDYSNAANTIDQDGIVGAMRWTVTSAGSIGARSAYSSGTTKAPVSPGQTVTGSIKIKQIAGSAKGARMRITFFDSSNSQVFFDDSASNTTLSGSWQVISLQSTAPAGAASAVISPYVQGASVGDVFLLDDSSMV